MSLKTRLDGRSEDNNLLQIKDNEGNILAEIKLLDNQSVNLGVVTISNVHVSKNNGWSSLNYKGA